MRITFKPLTFITMMLLLVVNTTFAQDGPHDPDIRLHVDEDWLILEVIYGQAISVEGLQFAVISSFGEDPELYRLTQRFNISDPGDQILLPDDCLVYRAVEDPSLPESCNPMRTYFSPEILPGDRFWLDENGQRQDVFVFRNGLNTGNRCPLQLDTCDIFYNTEPSYIQTRAVSALPTPELNNMNIGHLPDVTLRSNHGKINVLAWSHDRDVVVSGHDNGSLCLWTIDDELVIDPNPDMCTDSDVGHDEAITNIAWNPNSTTLQLLSASADSSVIRWEVASEALVLLNEYAHSGPVRDVAWHQAGETFITASEDKLFLWDTTISDTSLDFNISSPTTLAWRSDGRYVAVISENGDFRIIDTTKQEEFRDIANYGQDGPDIDWNQMFDEITTLDAEGNIRVHAFNASQPCVNRCQIATLAQNLPDATQIKSSPDGDYMALSMRGNIQIMEARSPYRYVSRLITNSGNDVLFTTLDWSRDNQQVIGGDDEGNIYIWNELDWEATRENLTQRLQIIGEPLEIDEFQNIPASALDWHHKSLAVGVVDAGFKFTVWDTAGNQIINVEHSGLPLDIDWHPELELVATGGCGPNVAIWRISESTETVTRIDDDATTTNCVTSLTFSPTGELLATVDEIGILRVYDWSPQMNEDRRPVPLTEKRIVTPESVNNGIAVNDIAYDTTGQWLAVVDDNGLIAVYDMARGSAPAEFTRVPEQGIALNTLAWSIDSTRLATGSENGWIAIWQLEDANREGVGFSNSYLLEAHQSAIAGVDWSRNGNLLVSASEDGHIAVWHALTGQLLAQRFIDTRPNQVKWSPTGTAFAVVDNSGFITLFQFNY